MGGPAGAWNAARALLAEATPTPDPSGLTMRPPSTGEVWLMLLLIAGIVAVFALAWWNSRRDERKP
ncbi:MAG TPA: hypothetical protein VFM49_08030 [Chloroflexia bacterium]|jgi:hypothetical protein|nr:hypothetical protein [Chloroflexia bacterium]